MTRECLSEQEAVEALLRGENRPPCSRLRLDLPTKRHPRALITKVGLGVKKSPCGGDVKEAKDRIAGVSGRRSRARTEAVKADSPASLVPRVTPIICIVSYCTLRTHIAGEGA